MSRRRADLPRYQVAKKFTDPFPEHEKMAPHVEVNWAIRDFLTYLADRGVFLSKVMSGKVVHVTDKQVEAALLEFRGVDADAFHAESERLMAKYGQAVEEAVRRGARASDPSYPSAVRIIAVLDQLGVPAWAGRPKCRMAMLEAGLSLPETGLFAQAVKLRKNQYGIVDQHCEQPELPLPEPEPVKPVEDNDKSLAALLGMIRES